MQANQQDSSQPTVPDRGGPIRFIMRYLIRGLLLVVPVAATTAILLYAFNWIGGLVQPPTQEGWSIPFTDIQVSATGLLWRALSALFVIAMIFGVGLLTSNVISQWVLRRIQEVAFRVPIIKLIYNSVRDMVGAFLSEEKKFDRPVLLSIGGPSDLEVIGFITREDLEGFERPGKVAVYVPQSYNFAANLILAPRERLTPIDMPAGDVMAFVVSGGVSGGVQPPAEASPSGKQGKR